MTEQTHHIIIPSYAAWFDYNRYRRSSPSPAPRSPMPTGQRVPSPATSASKAAVPFSCSGAPGLVLRSRPPVPACCPLFQTFPPLGSPSRLWGPLSPLEPSHCSLASLAVFTPSNGGLSPSSSMARTSPRLQKCKALPLVVLFLLIQLGKHFLAPYMSQAHALCSQAALAQHWDPCPLGSARGCVRLALVFRTSVRFPLGSAVSSFCFF